MIRVVNDVNAWRARLHVLVMAGAPGRHHRGASDVMFLRDGYSR